MSDFHQASRTPGPEVVGDCMYEQLRRLANNPDDLELLNCVLPGHEGAMDADDQSATDFFTCQKTGCVACVKVVQWFRSLYAKR